MWCDWTRNIFPYEITFQLSRATTLVCLTPDPRIAVPSHIQSAQVVDSALTQIVVYESDDAT